MMKVHIGDQRINDNRGERRDKNFKEEKVFCDTIVSQNRSSAKPPCRSARWQDLLQVDGWNSKFRSVQAWLAYLKSKRSGSEATRKSYCFILYRICAHFDANPDSILGLPPKRIRELMDGIISEMREKGRSLLYIRNYVNVLRSFLKSNKYKWLNKLDIDIPRIPPRYRKRYEYIPTPEEALKMAECAKYLRDKLIILLAAFSGLRLSTILALRYKDVRDELEKGVDNIKVEIYPEMKKVIPEACKGEIPYYTFTIKRATEYLRLYIEERKHIYGGIEDDEPIFTTTHNLIDKDKRRWKPLSKRVAEQIVKEAAEKAGLKQWMHVTPHSLRKTFQSFLRNQPEHTRLDIRDQEFLFGHILAGSMDNYYDKGKIEELRRKFSMMDPDLRRVAKQKLVSPDEVGTYVEDGWIVKFVLPNGMIVIEKP